VRLFRGWLRVRGVSLCRSHYVVGLWVVQDQDFIKQIFEDIPLAGLLEVKRRTDYFCTKEFYKELFSDPNSCICTRSIHISRPPVVPFSSITQVAAHISSIVVVPCTGPQILNVTSTQPLRGYVDFAGSTMQFELVLFYCPRRLIGFKK
jgi:hypothetical protein